MAACEHGGRPTAVDNTSLDHMLGNDSLWPMDCQDEKVLDRATISSPLTAAIGAIAIRGASDKGFASCGDKVSALSRNPLMGFFGSNCTDCIYTGLREHVQHSSPGTAVRLPAFSLQISALPCLPLSTGQDTQRPLHRGLLSSMDPFEKISKRREQGDTRSTSEIRSDSATRS